MELTCNMPLVHFRCPRPGSPGVPLLGGGNLPVAPFSIPHHFNTALKYLNPHTSPPSRGPRPVDLRRRAAAAAGTGGRAPAPSYVAPLYVYPVRTGPRERPSFVVGVDLAPGPVDPTVWVRRGTALLLATDT